MEEFYQEDLNEKTEQEETGYLEGLDEDQFAALDILRLFGKEKLENIQRMLSKATGLAFVTVDYKGDPITEATSFTRFCRAIRSNREVVMRCKASDAFGAIQAAVTQKPSVYYCPCGLLEVAIPIVLKGHYLGGFIGGQIRCNDAPEEVSHLKKVMPSPVDSLSREEYDGLLQEIPVYSYEKFQDIANLVFMIINQLSENEVSLHLQREEFQKKFKKLYAGSRKNIQDLKARDEQIREMTAKSNPYQMLDFLDSLLSLSILEGAEKTSSMVLLLIDFLRYSYMESGMSSLSKEIEFVEKYLMMQKVKFGDRFDYLIQIPQSLSMQRIPAGVLLPFVENAVFFGTMRKQDAGTVSIIGQLSDGRIHLQIEDNGPGLTEEELAIQFEPFGRDYDGYYIQMGMDNSVQRLKKVFKEEFELLTETKNGSGRRYQLAWPEHFSERVDS